MNIKKEKYIWLMLVLVTVVILLELEFILVLIGWGVFIYFISNVFDKERDRGFIISSVIALVSFIIFDEVRLAGVFREFEYDSDYRYFNLKSVGYLLFYWLLGFIYLFWLKKKPFFEEIEKIKVMLEKSTIHITNNKSGKVESICILLSEKDERYFYEINPEYLISQIKLIDEFIELKKDKKFYGYDYAIRFFYVGDKEIFNWYISN